MKNLLQLFLLLLSVFLPTTVFGFEEGGIYYGLIGNIDGTTSAIVVAPDDDSYTYSGDIVIPETVTHDGITYTVTEIDDKAFYNCTELTSVVIPQTVVAIGHYDRYDSFPGQSFANCTSLKSIVIPDNVEILGKQTFYGCSGLKSVTIGKSIQALRLKYRAKYYYAFQGCDSITSLTWNAVNCQDMGNMGTSNIEQVTIGPEVQIIPNSFVKQSKIQSVDIPNSVTTIGSSAFALCELLENTTVGNAVTSFGNSAFEGCSRLSSIAIPNSTTTMGDKVFYGCSSLESATIGNSVTSIGSQAFYGCSNLQNMVIPDLATSIGSRAFRGCSRLTDVTIGSSVTNIGIEAFYGCENLKKVNASSIESWCNIHFDSPNYVTGENPVSGELGFSNPLYYACHLYINNQEVLDIVIPNTITTINSYAFDCLVNLRSVSIPNSVTRIEDDAFFDCESLTSIEIPNSVTYIGKWTFGNCYGLTSASIGTSVDSIGNGAFHYCTGLPSIIIPNSVTFIGDGAFSGCQGVSDIIIPSSVKYIGHGAFSFCSLQSINVEDGNSDYDSRNNCNAIIETATNTLIAGCQNTLIPRSVTSIAPYAFDGCQHLASLFIPNTVTSIGIDELSGDVPFGFCYELESIIVEEGNPIYDSRDNCNAIIETATNTLIVGCKNTTFPNTVTKIGNFAFYGCGELTEIEIPNSIHKIGDHAFSNCYGLTFVKIGNTVDTIGEFAFFTCMALENIDFGKSVKYIGNDAFFYCTSLTNLEIPSSVNSIAQEAFRQCTGLTSVTIPNSYTVTERYNADLWFIECSGLTSVTIGSGMGHMGGMFLKCPNITSVTCLATTPPQTDIFQMTDENGQRVIVSNFDSEVYEQATLFVPAASLEAYKSAQFWMDFKDIRPIVIAGDVDSDGKVDISDVVDVISMLLNGFATIENYPGADMDGNGLIDIVDITAIIDMILKN